MGQQQLIYSILGTIVTGLAVTVGIVLFYDLSRDSAKEAVENDLILLAVKAKYFYMKPRSLGGGGHTFVGITSVEVLATPEFLNNENGRYFLVTPGLQHIVFRGYMKSPNPDGTYPRKDIIVTPTGYTLTPWVEIFTEIN